MPYIDYGWLRLAVPIGNVLCRMGWRRRTQKNHEARGPCPFHNLIGDKSRSFAVDLAADKWYCHRCKIGGDVIDLYATWKGLGAYEAALALCEEFHLKIPYFSPRASENGTGKRNGYH
jgi:DNA primase